MADRGERDERMTQIWAHARAGGITAMNTMVGYRQAVHDGADGLELDVHLSADGQLVCFHDHVVTLADGTAAPVGSLAVSDLRAVDIGDASTGTARMPLLSEVYELLAPTSLLLNIEAKNRPSPYVGFAEALQTSIAESAMSTRIVVSSADHRLLDNLRRLDGSIAVAPLVSDGLVAPWRYLREAGFDQAHTEYNEVADSTDLRAFREAGIAVRAWTINDPNIWNQLIDEGIDGIITDRPGEARAVRDARKANIG